jgi:hypothetical protein
MRVLDLIDQADEYAFTIEMIAGMKTTANVPTAGLRPCCAK